MTEAIPFYMSDLSRILLAYSEEYADIAEIEFPGMTVQAYMRGRLLNDLDDAMNVVVDYIYTNGGL
jgi:hypothetical protein